MPALQGSVFALLQTLGVTAQKPNNNPEIRISGSNDSNMLVWFLIISHIAHAMCKIVLFAQGAPKS